MLPYIVSVVTINIVDPHIVNHQEIDMATNILATADGNQVEIIKATTLISDLITIAIDPIRLQTDHMVVIVRMIVVMLQWTLAMRLGSRSVTSCTKSVIVIKIAKATASVSNVVNLDIMHVTAAV